MNIEEKKKVFVENKLLESVAKLLSGFTYLPALSDSVSDRDFPRKFWLQGCKI